jgi:uroporphyrinogen-III decarboxylase
MGVISKLAKATLYSRGFRFTELDGFERLIAGIYGRPDRIPVIMQPYTYAMGQNGLSARRFFSEPKPFIHASYNTATYFGVDFWSPVFDFYNIELEALGQQLIWRGKSEPDVDTANPLIKSEDDLKRLKPPQAGRSGRMPYVLESYRLFMDIMALPPMCYCCSPFTMAVLIRGYVNILRDMRRKPAFVHHLMEFLSMEVCVPWIAKMAELTDSSIISMSDAWASQPNMTPETVHEFCLPYIEKVIRETSTSMRTVLDTGSWGERSVKDPVEVLDIKMAMMLPGNNFKALRPFFLLVWNEDYEEIGIPWVRSYADRKKVCLALNFRPDLIERGPREAIVENVRKLVREAAGKGRCMFIINLVPFGTPVYHVHSLMAAIRKFGRYPIATDLDRMNVPEPIFVPFAEWLKKEGLPV